VIADFIRRIPKVELHVHMEGSIRPGTLLQLAKRHGIALPAETEEGLHEWYRFRDFKHFVEIYLTISSCMQDAEDVELITREFLQGQADQNILHTEATFTMWTLKRQCGLSMDDQLAAVNRAREWAARDLGISLGLVIDIVREVPVEDGLAIADWAIANHGNGVSALGLTGVEAETEPKKHAEAFRRALDAGLPRTCHAGETGGAWSIRGCLDDLSAERIGHGVRCLEDVALVRELRDRQIPLEVCPTSNVCIGVSPSLAEHPLPQLLNEGLNVSINSDDPPMFNTTLTDELIRCSETFGFNEDVIWTLLQNAGRATFLPEADKADLMRRLREGFSAGQEAFE
jgi:adenosine deaminase